MKRENGPTRQEQAQSDQKKWDGELVSGRRSPALSGFAAPARSLSVGVRAQRQQRVTQTSEHVPNPHTSDTQSSSRPSPSHALSHRRQHHDDVPGPDGADGAQLLVRVQLRGGVRAPGHARVDDRKLEEWILLRRHLHDPHFRRPALHAESAALPAPGRARHVEHRARVFQHRRRLPHPARASTHPQKPRCLPLRVYTQVRSYCTYTNSLDFSAPAPRRHAPRNRGACWLPLFARQSPAGPLPPPRRRMLKINIFISHVHNFLVF